MAVIMMTEGRGFSNAKAKRELGWQLQYPSWRQGFRAELARPEPAGITSAVKEIQDLIDRESGG